MPSLLVVGGGLFGSQAAAYARSKGIEAIVFDAGCAGAASPAAAGLFKEAWAGRRFHEHYLRALPLLERLYGVRSVSLKCDDNASESLLFVPPAAILEPNPVHQRVSSVGDGWVESDGRRYEGWVYLAAGIWCAEFVADVGIHGKAGCSFLFPGEHQGRIRALGHGQQAFAFVRDPGTTFFSDGTAQAVYTDEHTRQTLERASSMGLSGPIRCYHGWRPYTPGGPVFRKLGSRTWLATGGRKFGTIVGASFALRLVDQELR
jgi:glycine/D-amino acid oxidase-like deaminating enzyme